MSRREPAVSVVLCTFNRANLLPRAVESVLGQDYDDLELLIIDDASTDETQSLVMSFKDDRIVYIRNSENIGAAASRNKGISLSRGSLVAFQDSDDVWLPGKLSRQVGALEDAHVFYGACYSSLLRVSPTGISIFPGKDAASDNDDLFEKLLRYNLIDMPTLLARKECLMGVGALDERLARLIDWDLALRLAREYNIYFCREPLLLSYHTESSISENVDAYINAIDLILSKYAEHYEGKWFLVMNHYLFNAKYLVKNQRYAKAVKYLGKALRILYDRMVLGRMRI